MASRRFQELQDRVEGLRRHLLPFKFDPTGTYKFPDRVATRALSFRVLVHAEFEAYFEDRVLEVAAEALKAWEASRYISATSIHLLAFCGRTMELPPDRLSSPDANKSKEWLSKTHLGDRFAQSITDFNRRVRRENHGIKEANLMTMLMPIGFDMSRCDQLLLQAMNAFGEARGIVAHTSGHSHVQRGVDPKDEYDTISKIVASLAAVDTEIERLLNITKP